MILQKAGNAVLVKKSGRQVEDQEELERTVETFGRDMVKVEKYAKTAERAIAANLSRHIGSQPQFSRSTLSQTCGQSNVWRHILPSALTHFEILWSYRKADFQQKDTRRFFPN